MAIEDVVVLDSGLEVSRAYIRIDTVSGFKEKITISVNTYISKQKFKEGLGYLSQKTYTFVPTVEVGSENFIKQGYEYLKSLDEYAHSVNIPFDCGPD
ncbi:MAG: hypothetical protein RR533_07005 [Carnobacterium sp.]